MQGYIPSVLNLPRTFNSYTLQFTSLNSNVIEKHTQAIQQIVCEEQANSKAPTNPLITQLNSDSFWLNLTIHSSGAVKEKVTSLQKLWQEVGPLAHLTTKELLHLLEGHLLPLERAYQYFDMQQHPEHVRSQILINNDKLQRLKMLVFQGLLNRSTAHQYLNAPSNTDDVLAAFCAQVNSLGLSARLVVTQPYSATLDHNRRLRIYFHLKDHFDDKLLHERVLYPIPKKGYERLTTQQEVKKELDEADQFRKNMIDLLKFGGSGEDLYILTALNSTVFSKIKSFFQGIGKEIQKNILMVFNEFWELNLIQKMLTMFYFVLSFTAYLYINQMLQWLPFISSTTAGILSGFAFFAIGLAPLWFPLLQGIGGTVKDYILSWKKQEILDTFALLESIQFLLSSRLSHVVVDITRFDIEELVEMVEDCLQGIDKAFGQLQRFSLLETLLSSHLLQTQLQALQDRLKGKTKELKSRTAKFAGHIASRVGQDIELLEESTASECAPILPQSQLEKLRSFVEKYGDPQAEQLFTRSINIVEKWLSKLNNHPYLKRVEISDLHEPWGEYHFDERYLTGWEPVLKAFTSNSTQRDAALQLNGFLKGKVTMGEHRFHTLIDQLVPSDKTDWAIQQIRTFLFHTLNASTAQNATCLSEQHKNQLRTWRIRHQSDIAAAEVVVQQILSQFPQQTEQLMTMDPQKLNKYYRLLDGVDICRCAEGNVDPNERHNLARKYFENYDGSHSFALVLTRFLTKDEKRSILVQISAKRLNWLLGDLPAKQYDPEQLFDKRDLSLFQEALHAGFEIQTFIENSAIFKQPWNDDFARFLEQCPRFGIATKRALDQYKQRQPQKQPLIPSALRTGHLNAAGGVSSMPLKAEVFNHKDRKSVYAY
ncbi:MAG: hypothetical protein ACHQJ6_03195 [Candidatus Berkiellales bacterium]